MRRRFFLLAGCVLVLGLGLAAAGCGGETASPTPETVQGTLPSTTPAKGDPAAGKKLFASAGCGSCHVLADAGSTGSVGPSLDQAKPSLGLVTDLVANGKGAMPSFGSQLTEQEIADVAAYVVQATQG